MNGVIASLDLVKYAPPFSKQSYSTGVFKLSGNGGPKSVPEVLFYYLQKRETLGFYLLRKSLFT